MVLVYILTIAITAVWILRSISVGKLIFRRTILDIPLFIFLGSQLISTIISIDPQTSWFGYYSRFNGGLFSTISYLLLYWAFVSNVGKEKVTKLIIISLWSGLLISIYGVLERLGIDKNIWQQDVQSRVFSTLGQPNWLAAWLIVLIPITWALIIEQEDKKLNLKSIYPYALSSLFFVVLLFTGSRSGLLGFVVIEFAFWAIIFFRNKLKYIKEFVIINFLILLIVGIFGTQFSPSIFDLFTKNKNVEPTSTVQTSATALETGGTESGTIRKIVWQGAVEIWKHYPIFGTGVETFAYSYYLHRPVIHNITSEWDFIYNKAHNEYLNLLANTGTVGILSYLSLIAFTVYLMTKNLTTNNEKQNDKSSHMVASFISGYLSILVTNFFGFSVVPIQILFYLLPAFTVIVANQKIEEEIKNKPTSNQKILKWIVICTATSLIIITCRYWYADILYSKGVNYNKVNRQDLSPKYLDKAIKLSPKQSLYYAEIAKAYTGLALVYNESKESTLSSQLAKAAIDNSTKAIGLTPANVNLKRMEFGVFVMLSTINPNYLINARDVLISAVTQAPTDAKIHYNLGLIYSRTGQNDLALQTLKKTTEMKPNYKDARLAYSILLIDAGKKAEAKIQLQYILINIDPTDSISKQYLESIK